MIPTLEDVGYLTGLPVQGEPIVGHERRDYYDDVVELLGPEFVAGRRRAIRSILLGSLSEAVGLRGGRRGALETFEEFGADIRASIQLGDRSEEQLVRIFVVYMFGRLLFSTQSSQMNNKFVLLVRDLAYAGRYTWGAAMLGHLFSLLPSSSLRSQSTWGFTSFLQIWGYTCFPMGGGVQREGSQAMVPLMDRWEVVPDLRVTDRRVDDVHVGFDLYPHDQTPYLGEPYMSHPTVAAGRLLFNCHLLLLCLGTCEPLYLEIVVRTLGWHQPALEVPSLAREGHSRRRFFTEDQDWGEEHGSTIEYWRGGGEQMLESEAVRLLEGRLAEQAVEMERFCTETHTLKEELARVRASRDTGASSSAQPASGDLAVRLQEAPDRAKASGKEQGRPSRHRWRGCGWRC
ncbi:hypothetical protein Taro_042920 [Colocasia esculenta]|uniref:Aminotransferase-like plant mobile domain-containing protein n=1 Tax=Colocasia esculenta TaxID=4460 RepID=A0A843WXR1_COLES|nr:hypothetical protein [Colocasia esculenta]